MANVIDRISEIKRRRSRQRSWDARRHPRFDHSHGAAVRSSFRKTWSVCLQPKRNGFVLASLSPRGGGEAARRKAHGSWLDIREDAPASVVGRMIIPKSGHPLFGIKRPRRRAFWRATGGVLVSASAALSPGSLPVVSQFLAGGHSAPGRSPDAAGDRACEARARPPHPLPSSRRLRKTPLAGPDQQTIITGKSYQALRAGAPGRTYVPLF